MLTQSTSQVTWKLIQKKRKKEKQFNIQTLLQKYMYAVVEGKNPTVFGPYSGKAIIWACC